MPSAASVRLHIEASLARKIPSALTPAPHTIRPATPTGINEIDTLLEGGLTLGAITELVGPECSGRTSVALSAIARLTRVGRVCAWVDVLDALDPESAAASGVDLARLLWVRCGAAPTPEPPSQPPFKLPEKYFVAPPSKRGLHGGGFGPHPRTEASGLSEAVPGLLRAASNQCLASTQPKRASEPQSRSPLTACSQHSARGSRSWLAQQEPASGSSRSSCAFAESRQRRPWSRLEQALRATDLLLQGGGFSAIVLDMGSVAPEDATRIPLATWFRYRAAAEHAQASFLLLTQHPCAKSSAGLVLRLLPGEPLVDEPTLFTGCEHRIEAAHRRFTGDDTNIIPLRKPVQRESGATWHSRTAWAGRP